MNSPFLNIAILVLAAGASLRMGRSKQLLAWQGTTLLGHTIKTAKTVNSDEITLVLGAKATLIKSEMAKRTDILSHIDVVENKRWATGLGSSIACGVNRLLLKNKHTDGILVVLADQPFVDTTYLNHMIRVFTSQPTKIVASAYGDRGGVPAIFSKLYFNRLKQLKDDFGAKELLKEARDSVLVLQSKKSTIDIDTPADYQKLL